MSYTALQICSQFGLGELLLDHLDQGSLSVNAGTEMGTTPIIKAASRGFFSTVKILLDRGAEPYLENWYCNALHCAAEAGNCAIIRELVTYGMSPNSCKQYLRSPLSCTIDNDHAEAFETLIMLEADINGIDYHCNGGYHGLSILHLVALYDSLNIMDVILKHGWVDLKEDMENGHKLLFFAASRDNLLMVRKLVEARANIEVEGG